MFLCVVSLGATSSAALLSLSFETSATTHAMGGYNTTVGNAWNSDPLMSYTNPALAAFQEGFSYSVIKYKWLPDAFDDWNYHAAFAVIGYKGIALTLPALNQNSNWGIYMDFGEQEQWDSAGNSLGTFHSYDAYKAYGVAINPFEVYREFAENPHPVLKHFDLAMGMSYIDIDSFMATLSGLTDSAAEVHTSIYNLGLLAKAKYRFGDFLNAEGSFGLTRFNPQNKKVSYIDSEYADPIVRYRNTGFGVFCSVPVEPIRDYVPSEYLLTDNLISLKWLHGQHDELFGYEDEITTGYGVELGLLDTIYLRQGHYEDEAGGITGDTKGFGIKLHYKEYFAIRYNQASFPGGSLTKEHKSHDMGVNINFLKVMEAIRS
jgi:hypothetical protein